MASEIWFNQVTKHYANGTEHFRAIEEVTFRVAPGEFLSILGPSGCGKSTVIKLVAGFVKATSGGVLVNRIPVRGPGPDRVVVAQDYSLFAWKTVYANVEFGLKARGLPKAERKKQTEQFLELVHLTHAAQQYPVELSGGMRQRVALARALAVSPSCLLLDEPLAALDVQMRQRLQEEILNLWSQTKQTVLLVTHDLDEALFLSDRVVVMGSNPGHVRIILPIPFAHPRLPELRLSDQFLKLKRKVYTYLE